MNDEVKSKLNDLGFNENRAKVFVAEDCQVTISVTEHGWDVDIIPPNKGVLNLHAQLGFVSKPGTAP